jgi:parvulin-like peptidyl-prolyl isomerase
MNTRVRLFLVPLAVLALLAAGCGGGGKKSATTTATTATTGTSATGTTPTSTIASASLGPNDVATVGPEHITKADFAGVLAQAKSSYTLQKRTFPAAGSPDYQTLVGQVMNFLVQKAEFAQKAKELGITVTDKQVEDRLAQVKKQCCGGDDKRYEQQLQKSGITDAQFRDDLKSQLYSEQIYNKITANLKVSDAEVSAYYKQHVTDQYTTPAHTNPASRDVRHILVKTKALADKLYDQLQHGADFATLVNKYTLDTGSKATGGKLTAVKGQVVPEFQKVAFSIKTKEIAKPVHSQFGWHIIQALSDVKPPQKVPAKVEPFSQAKSSIQGQLLSNKKAASAQAWITAMQAQFAPTIHYAPGYTPPPSTSTTPTTTTG